MRSGGFHLIMNPDFLIIVSIILLLCQRTWKGDSFIPSPVGFLRQLKYYQSKVPEI